MQFNTESNNIGKLVTRYVHNINKETVMSSVDISTNTFTSVSHGLSNGTAVCPFTNKNAGKVHPLSVYSGGMTQVLRYYIINATTDTFKISTTLGGTALDITSTGDLTKWHFESFGVTSFSVSSLPPSKKYKCILWGKTAGNNFLNLFPDAPNYWNDGSSIRYADGTWGICSIASSPNFFMYVEAYFDSTGVAKADYRGQIISINSAPNFSDGTISNTFLFTNTAFADSNITSIMYQCGELIANGTTMEVYSV